MVSEHFLPVSNDFRTVVDVSGTAFFCFCGVVAIVMVVFIVVTAIVVRGGPPCRWQRKLLRGTVINLLRYTYPVVVAEFC